MARNPIVTVRDLEGLREEIRLQLHLAGKELQDQYAKTEQRWTEFRRRLADAGLGAEVSLDQLSSALTLLGEELRASYERVRDGLTGGHG